VYIIEGQLGRIVKDTTGRAYSRTAVLKERKETMPEWADFICFACQRRLSRGNSMPKDKPPRDRSPRTTRWAPQYFNQSRCKRFITLYKLDIDPKDLSAKLDGAVSWYFVVNDRPKVPSATETKESLQRIQNHCRKLKRELDALSVDEIVLINRAAKGDIVGLNEVLTERGLEPASEARENLVRSASEICFALETTTLLAADRVSPSKVGPKGRDDVGIMISSLALIYDEFSLDSDKSPIKFILDVVKKFDIPFGKSQSLSGLVESALNE